jgi:hypothetical protein
MVAVLKAVQPEALSTQTIVDKAKELGIREFEEKDKNKIATVRCACWARCASFKACCARPQACCGPALCDSSSIWPRQPATCVAPGSCHNPLLPADSHAPFGFPSGVQALTSDRNFLRIGKGAYSLHCFHPEAEHLVKAPQPKAPKEPKEGAKQKKAAAAAAGTPSAAGGDATPGKAGASTTKKAAKQAAKEGGQEGKEPKEAVPMVRVEAKPLEVGLPARLHTRPPACRPAACSAILPTGAANFSLSLFWLCGLFRWVRRTPGLFASLTTATAGPPCTACTAGG